ncbi:MAG TPA: tripartite tricarboxylate transporter substrate-binding protein [Reyranella sp.]
MTDDKVKRRLTAALCGNGSVGQLSGELLRMMTGVELQHVPYRGNAPALADLLSGQVAVTFASSALPMGYVKSGKLRAIAVTSATRSETMPDVPALAEAVPGYEVASWYGIGAPRATPAAVVDRLNKEIGDALANLAMKARQRHREMGQGDQVRRHQDHLRHDGLFGQAAGAFSGAAPATITSSVSVNIRRSRSRSDGYGTEQ